MITWSERVKLFLERVQDEALLPTEMQDEADSLLEDYREGEEN